MANVLYEKARQNFLVSNNLDWDSGSASAYGVVLVASEYTVNLVTHASLGDITAAHRVASAALESLTASDGVADAADVTMASVSGSVIYYIIGFRHTGAEATASLIWYMDTGTGLPLTPNGGDVTVQWSAGACRIFRL